MPPKKTVSDRQLQLLAMVANEELNGRAVAATYEDLVGETIPFGTLYKVLDDMENTGLVTSREIRNGRRTRRFKITAEGRKALKEGRKYRIWLAEFATQPKKTRRAGGSSGPAKTAGKKTTKKKARRGSSAAQESGETA